METPTRMAMRHQVDSQDKGTHSEPLRASGIAWVSLVLAAIPCALPFIKGGGFDVPWCAALSSAWLNVWTVALAICMAGLADRRRATSSTSAGSWRWQVWQLAWWRSAGAAAYGALRPIRWQLWAMLACAALSVFVASLAWHPLLRFAPPALPARPGVAVVAAAGLLALAFGTLVAELFYTSHADRGRAWTSLANVLRVALATTLVAAACAALLAYAGLSARWPARAMAVFNAAIATEFALRAALSWFTPPHARELHTNVPDSLIASLLRWHPSPLTRFTSELRSRYGIDLRQNWVLQSVVRLLPATIVTIGIGAWLLTGVVILRPDQRAVYERFGAPVAVWQPGVHVALPRPFGNVRALDNGAIHQLVVSGAPEDSSVAIPLIPADARTPEQINRLWDVAHPGGTNQVIAGASGDRQNFQIVSADVRLDYRIGLSDAAARAALYRAADVPGTVRAIANRAVVRYLASHTLASLLETRQTVMADSVRRDVQAQLDEMSSGIDVIAMVIESVHPPTGASAAYHGVQATQIRAQASVAQARGLAAALLGDAQQQAHMAIAQAQAKATEITSAARVQQTSFSADMLAWQAGGPAFAFEYYLHILQKGLADAQVTVIDDRLVQGNRATIDLRPYGAGNAAGAKHVD